MTSTSPAKPKAVAKPSLSILFLLPGQLSRVQTKLDLQLPATGLHQPERVHVGPLAAQVGSVGNTVAVSLFPPSDPTAHSDTKDNT